MTQTIEQRAEELMTVFKGKTLNSTDEAFDYLESLITQALKREQEAMWQKFYDMIPDQLDECHDCGQSQMFDLTGSIEKKLEAIRNQNKEGWAMEWQPIETAPSIEYRKVLVWVKMFYAPSYMGLAHWQDGKWRVEGETRSAFTITHWMPLPEPPKEKNDE